MTATPNPPCAKQEERINLNQLFDGYSELDWIGKKSTREDISSNANNPKASLRKYARSLYDTARFINNPLVKSRQATGFDFINHAIDIKRDGDWTTKMETISGMLQHHDEASQGVHGLGPALARDLLKECRCLWFSKPNTHLIGVLQGLGLMQVNDNITTSTEGHANELCRLVYRFAEVARNALVEPRITPYRVDKMIWLMCTGNFYLEKNQILRRSKDYLISSLIAPRSTG